MKRRVLGTSLAAAFAIGAIGGASFAGGPEIGATLSCDPGFGGRILHGEIPIGPSSEVRPAIAAWFAQNGPCPGGREVVIFTEAPA